MKFSTASENRVENLPANTQKPNPNPLILVGNNSAIYVNIIAKFIHITNFILLPNKVSSHYKVDSFIDPSNKPKINKMAHKIVIINEQPKLSVLLFILSPIGIIKKFPINSEIPKKTPFIYIFDKPSRCGINTDKA